jgi:RND family efflux transporter MFP subunit
MTKMKPSMRTLLVFGMATGMAGWAIGQAVPEAGSMEVAYTIPKFQSEQSFDDIGIVKEVPVEVGDRVKKGDILASLDRRIHEAELEKLRIEATSGLRVEAAKAELEVSKVQLENKKNMGDAASPLEIQEAELTVLVNEIKVQLEEEALQVSKLKYEQQKVKVETMQLRAEFDGIVAKVDVSLGETVDPDRPAITVVQNDPLRVQLNLATEKAHQLKPGETLQVRYNSNDAWRDAKVHFISPVALADSGYQLVELELPNPDNMAAGVNMMVKLPERLNAPQAEAAAAR